ncbi:MAG: hypothetical protein RL653_4322 [Pseudomonadota bacterium]|jgi:hypothetical protein
MSTSWEQVEREDRERALEKAKQAQFAGLHTALTGVGVGAVSAVGALAIGAACPACVLVTPVLVGVGALQGARGTWLRWKAEKALAGVTAPGPAPQR